MQAHHYLGSLAKIGENLWYVATILGEWVALSSISAAALKCVVRYRYRLEFPTPVLAYRGSMGEFRQGMIGCRFEACITADRCFINSCVHRL